MTNSNAAPQPTQITTGQGRINLRRGKISRRAFLIDSENVVHYSVDCPLKVGSYTYEGEFDVVVIEKDTIAYGNIGELEPRRSKLCQSCTGSFIQRFTRGLLTRFKRIPKVDRT